MGKGVQYVNYEYDMWDVSILMFILEGNLEVWSNKQYEKIIVYVQNRHYGYQLVENWQNTKLYIGYHCFVSIIVLDIDDQLYIYNLGKIKGVSSIITNSTPLRLPKHRPLHWWM